MRFYLVRTALQQVKLLKLELSLMTTCCLLFPSSTTYRYLRTTEIIVFENIKLKTIF